MIGNRCLMQTQMQSLLMQRILVTFSIAQFLILNVSYCLLEVLKTKCFQRGIMKLCLKIFIEKITLVVLRILCSLLIFIIIICYFTYMFYLFICCFYLYRSFLYIYLFFISFYLYFLFLIHYKLIFCSLESFHTLYKTNSDLKDKWYD